jgi:hypothetical protein
MVIRLFNKDASSTKYTVDVNDNESRGMWVEVVVTYFAGFISKTLRTTTSNRSWERCAFSITMKMLRCGSDGASVEKKRDLFFFKQVQRPREALTSP